MVYGDIGTSPLYAFREALHATGTDHGAQAPVVLGLLSILIWTLILIVTVKYVFVLLRADNRGEGGILALYTLVRLALGRRSTAILALAIAGAALFAGDAAITPAISVLSAVEGMGLVLPHFEPYILPVTLAILFGLFVMQGAGTARVAKLFGPITVVWFLALGGLWHIGQAPQVLAAFNPLWGARFLIAHSAVAFAVLGAVFLAVTGGEALYADLGHFGRKPITAAWFVLVLPSLVLCYLGQGAMVLADPTLAQNAFFAMCPPALLPWLVALATAATVIASQAVISGAFSMARGAVQLGFLPRLNIRHTAQDQSGQIYIPVVNWALAFGVVWLVLSFGSSSALASAYGIAVTGTMVLTTVLGAAFFLTSDADRVPSALLHNLKHNRVLHEQTVLLTVETLRLPYALPEERALVEPLGGNFLRLTLRFGFMEDPNVSRAMAQARRAGLRFDVMTTTFFLGRRRPVPTGEGLELIADRIFAAMSRFAADPTDYFHLPRDRVVELGERVAI